MSEQQAIPLSELRAIVGDEAADMVIKKWRLAQVPPIEDLDGARRVLAGGKKRDDIARFQRLAALWVSSTRARYSFVAWLERQAALLGGTLGVDDADMADQEPVIDSEPVLTTGDAGGSGSVSTRPKTHDTSGGDGEREPRNAKSIFTP